MPDYEQQARALGWFPTKEAHVLFRYSTGVCRYLKGGETYNEETDSYVSRPLRHAKTWQDAVEMDTLGQDRESYSDEQDRDCYT